MNSYDGLTYAIHHYSCTNILGNISTMHTIELQVKQKENSKSKTLCSAVASLQWKYFTLHGVAWQY